MERWRTVGYGMVLALMGTALGCQSATSSSSGQSVQSPANTAADAAQVRRKHPQPAKGTAPGTFDYYLLTLSWSPEYCVAHPTDAQCGPQPGFVLHGLWPENTNGTYPEACSTAAVPGDPAAYKDIYPDQSLLEHEWKEHGTCSGLAPDAYFQLERKAKASVAIPANLTGKQTPAQETPASLLSSFAQANPGAPAASFLLSCGNNRLTAVQACLDKNLKTMSCPAMKSCAASVVKITPPGATKD